MPLRIVFMGSADLSCASLSALLARPDIKVTGVVTQPDRPKGRGMKLVPGPVKELALRHQLPVLQPEKARTPGFLDELKALDPELIVVAAFGQILPKSILDLPRFGCINVHTSLLPKYRGAGPIQWAILNGETETGVTIMKMDVGLDTGDILTRQPVAIRPEDDGSTLHDRLAETGARLLVETIPGYVNGTIKPTPQPSEGATYAPKISKQDGAIDWTSPAIVIWNRVRGLFPWPGAWTMINTAKEGGRPGGAPLPGEMRRLKILKATPVGEASGVPGTVLQADKELVVACGKGAVKILQLQMEGGRPLAPKEFLSGHKIPVGYGFGGAGANPSIQ